MRARWVLHRPSPEPPVVGQAIVARWWPGRYYLVSTIEMDQSSPLAKLTQSLIYGRAYGEALQEPSIFVTQVFKCDQDGLVRSFDNPFYEREYTDLSQAQTGHRETLRLLAEGRLKLAPRAEPR